MTPRRAVLPFALALALTSRDALADVVHECGTAAERGQRLREKRSLKAARDEFIACAKDRCPTAIRVDCASWLTDVEQRMPSIVVRATDHAGRDLTDVRMFVDGELARDRLDGSRVEIDPGERTLRFERGNDPPVAKKIVVREGERNRPIDLVLGVEPKQEAVKPPTTEKPSQGSLVLPIVLAGVGVVGIAGFAFFAGTGKSDLDDLRATCAPRCPQSDVDSAEQKILIGNISLGVGIVALGAAAILFFTQGPTSMAARRPGLSF